jgi:hypothetical protein
LNKLILEHSVVETKRKALKCLQPGMSYNQVKKQQKSGEGVGFLSDSESVD